MIERYLSDSVFENFQSPLGELFREIRKKSINMDADFWDMQIGSKDTVKLYYKGFPFNLELKVENGEPSYRLWVKDEMKKNLDKIMEKAFLENMYNKPISIGSITLCNFFRKYHLKFEAAVNAEKTTTVELEHKRNQYIAALVEKELDCVVIDYEVEMERLGDKESKVSFQEACKVSAEKESKEYKRLDLLVLRKNSKDKYEFLPVEIRVDENASYREAVCEINTYTRILKADIEDALLCYQSLAVQKAHIGIFNQKLQNLEFDDIEENISKALVIVLYDEKISKNAQKEKHLKEISRNCEKCCGL